MKHCLIFFSTLLGLGFTFVAQAACNRYPNSQNSVSFPSTITVPESLGVGQLITSQVFSGPYPTFYMYCHSPTPTFLTGRFTSAISAAGGLIYHTNVPGIGMRVMVTLTSGARDFELTANCTNASNVTFRVSGAPAPGNALLFANTGSAGGVALWMYSRINGVPATISNNGTRTLAVSGNRAVLPLGAAYHRNGTVSQGTLASTATVNITYN